MSDKTLGPWESWREFWKELEEALGKDIPASASSHIVTTKTFGGHELAVMLIYKEKKSPLPRGIIETVKEIQEGLTQLNIELGFLLNLDTATNKDYWRLLIKGIEIMGMFGIKIKGSYDSKAFYTSEELRTFVNKHRKYLIPPPKINIDYILYRDWGKFERWIGEWIERWK